MQITFGCRDPSPQRRAPRFRKKGDFFYSETNYNMIVESGETLTLGEFIKVLTYGQPCQCAQHRAHPEHGPNWLWEKDFQTTCSTCQESTKVPCALAQDPAGTAPPDATPEELAKAMMWDWKSIGPLRSCPIVNSLLPMTETAAETKFYELYLRSAFPPFYSERLMSLLYEPEFSRVLQSRGYKNHYEVGSQTWFHICWELLLGYLDSPALIPQVVLNFVGAESLPDDHPDKHFYESDVGRIDFVFFDARGTHLVEIDGPYHHRNEEDYTRLLRQDRTLRGRGYYVHRFSNLEVMRAENFRPFERELFDWWETPKE